VAEVHPSRLDPIGIQGVIRTQAEMSLIDSQATPTDIWRERFAVLLRGEQMSLRFPSIPALLFLALGIGAPLALEAETPPSSETVAVPAGNLFDVKSGQC
jgi:hypothetical protein